jgi:hypothetical protein
MDGKDESRKVPGSESVERPWASNDKLLFDASLGHIKGLMNLSELSVKSAVEFQQKSNDAYLEARDRREQQRMVFDSAREQQRMEHADALERQRVSHSESMEAQRMEHSDELETMRQENNRYTLNYLYGIGADESAAVVAIGKLVLDAAKKNAASEE